MDFEAGPDARGCPVHWEATDAFLPLLPEEVAAVVRPAAKPVSPPLRARLHAACVLYAFAEDLEHRAAVVDLLKDMVFELAATLAAGLALRETEAATHPKSDGALPVSPAEAQ